MKKTTNSEIKKIKAKISRYKSSMKKEKEITGFISDGGGNRYLICPLYLMINETKKAIDYLQWYETEFEDDYGEPFHTLSWVVALFNDNQIPKAFEKLVDLIETNLYIVPFTLGEDYTKFDVWHSTNMAEPEYLEFWPEEYEVFITDNFKTWLKELYHKQETQNFIKELIKIRLMLTNEKRVEKRKIIIANEDQLIMDFKRNSIAVIN